MNSDKNHAIADIVNSVTDSLNFNILEIGARPLDNSSEPFHCLLDLFSGTKIYAFEVDQNVCEKLNQSARQGLRYYPIALGCKEEYRLFYETNHPMCSSLYKPNDALSSLYNNMEVALLKSVSSICTVSLDYFVRENKIFPVDFIKIDIQGAELDVFQGGTSALQSTVAIVSEVEFIPIYEKQPLFGDICAFLSNNEFVFHKFLGLASRSLKPITLNNNPNVGTQHIWSDAFFVKNIEALSHLSTDQLLKLGILAFLYTSPDITFFCFSEYDKREGVNLTQELLALGSCPA